MLVSKVDDLCLWAESSIGHNKPPTPSPLSRRLSRPPAAICAKPVSRPRKLRLSRELAEKNIRLNRRENCGLNTKNPLLIFFLKLFSNRHSLLRFVFRITPPVRCTGLRSVKMRLAHSQLSRTLCTGLETQFITLYP